MQRNGCHVTCFKLRLESLLLLLLLCDVHAGVIEKRQTKIDPDIMQNPVVNQNVSTSTKLLPHAGGMQDNFKSKQMLDKIDNMLASEQLLGNDIELTTSKSANMELKQTETTTTSTENTLPELENIAVKQQNVSRFDETEHKVLRLKPLQSINAASSYTTIQPNLTLMEVLNMPKPTVAEQNTTKHISATEKRAKFINDNSTNAQLLNLPDAAEVWSLAGMKSVQPKLVLNATNAVNEKNLHDWTQIMLNSQLMENGSSTATSTSTSTMSSKLLQENTVSEEEGVEMLLNAKQSKPLLKTNEDLKNDEDEVTIVTSLNDIITTTPATASTSTMAATLDNILPHNSSPVSLSADNSTRGVILATTTNESANVVTNLEQQQNAKESQHIESTTLATEASQSSITTTSHPDIYLSYSSSLSSTAPTPTTSQQNDDNSAAKLNADGSNESVDSHDVNSNSNGTALAFSETTTFSTLEASTVHGTTPSISTESAQISNSTQNEEDAKVIIVAAETKDKLVATESTTEATILATTTTTTARTTTFDINGNSKEQIDNEVAINTKFNNETSEQSIVSTEKTTIKPETTTTITIQLDNELLNENATIKTTTTDIIPIITPQSSTSGSVAIEVTSTLTTVAPANNATKIANEITNTTAVTDKTLAAKEHDKLLAKTTNADTENSLETNAIDSLDKNTPTTTTANTPNIIEIAISTTTTTTTTKPDTIPTTTTTPVNIIDENNKQIIDNDEVQQTKSEKDSIEKQAEKKEQTQLNEQLNTTSISTSDMDIVNITATTTTTVTPKLATTTTETPVINLLDDSTRFQTTTVAGNINNDINTTTETTNASSVNNKIEEVYKILTTTPYTTTTTTIATTTTTEQTVAKTVATTETDTEVTTAAITTPSTSTTTNNMLPPSVTQQTNDRTQNLSYAAISPSQQPPAPPPPAIFNTDNLHHPNSAHSGETDVNVIIAITVSVIGVVALLLLVAFLYLMRKRQKQMSYSQRCRPVSLDAYSLDNVSVLGSVRRKGALRASKKSYGNAAFDDPSLKHHVLNAMELSKFIERRSAIFEEFRDVPQIIARADEVPPGCEDKNRYANVIPLPETRVILQQQNDDEKTEYINANYVRGPKDPPNYYIACQAPLETTIVDFWRMIWEQQSRVIIQATDLIENGIEKCGEYLPPSPTLDNHTTFGDFQVTLKHREIKDKYAISTLLLKNTLENESRELTHYWYRWPEAGVPSEEAPIIAMLLEARSSLKSYAIEQANELKEKSSTLTLKSVESDQGETDEQTASHGNGVTISSTEINGNISSNDKLKAAARNQGPLTVHCSPGTGRTGTIISCDMAIRSLETPKRSVDIPQIVYYVRRGRASAVQTKEQYEFIYKVALMYATKITNLSNEN